MSMSMPTLTPAAARALHLAAQGLLAPSTAPATPDAVVAAIERMGVLQIDTIHVVARSPYLVLFSRLGAWPPSWLEDLLAQGRLFETWAHEACFAAIADWPWLRRNLDARDHHWSRRDARQRHARDRAGMRRVLDELRAGGPQRSGDGADARAAGNGGWWGWSTRKRRLEAWFALGEVMVARRERFQRVYDVSDRVLAGAGIDHGTATLPTPAAARSALIERSVRALGIARLDWIADYYRLGRRIDADELAPLVEAGRLRPVAVRGWSIPAFVHADHDGLLAGAATGRLRPRHTTVLSPFDPVVWDRARALDLFGFDYRLECYLPAARRSFGYFTLPLLHRGHLVGRLDAKAHRAEGVFEVRRIALEAASRDAAGMAETVGVAIGRLAAWHGARRVAWSRIAPRSAAAALRRGAVAGAAASAHSAALPAADDNDR